MPPPEKGCGFVPTELPLPYAGLSQIRFEGSALQRLSALSGTPSKQVHDTTRVGTA